MIYCECTEIKNRMALNNSLVIIDTNAFLHSVITVIDRGNYSQKEKDNIMVFNAMYMLSGAFLDKILPYPYREIEIVFAMDLQPYWRKAPLSKIGCNYKNKRNPQSHRAIAVEPYKEFLYNFLMEEYDLPLFTMFVDKKTDNEQLVGFEADDIAAGIVLTRHQNYKKIFVLTDDNDWLPFVQFPNVTWLGIHNRLPRIRDEEITLEWLRTTSHETQKTKERKAYQFNHLSDLWAFKAYFGDTSDNIPGDKKDKTLGRYIEFIDLFNPSVGFKSWEQPDFAAKFESSKLVNPEIMSIKDIYDTNNGVPLAIPPYWNHTGINPSIHSY